MEERRVKVSISPGSRDNFSTLISAMMADHVVWLFMIESIKWLGRWDGSANRFRLCVERVNATSDAQREGFTSKVTLIVAITSGNLAV
jgi:hypothetical protein